jgi:von Willebrand factor type A domain
LKTIHLSLGATSFILGLALAAVPACSTAKPATGFGEVADAGVKDTGAFVDFGGDGNVPDTGIGGEGCGGGEVVAQKVPVYFLFVADGSGSMSSDNKWRGQAEALKAIFEKIAAQTTAQAAAGQLADTAAGLIVFSDTRDKTGGSGPYPSAADVSIRLIPNVNAAADFWGRLAGAPEDLTPTKKALDGAYKSIEMYTPGPGVKPNGKRVVVLLSDGEPTDDTPTGSIHQLAESKSTPGPKVIYTYAIGVGSGIGSGYDPEFMAGVAQSGKTAPSNCDPTKKTNPDCFFQIDPTGGKSTTQITADMVAALETIRIRASECDLSLVLIDKDGNPADPNRVEVSVVDEAGVESTIPQDGPDGWAYDDPMNPTRIILSGAACVRVSSSADVKPKVKFGCKPKSG